MAEPDGQGGWKVGQRRAAIRRGRGFDEAGDGCAGVEQLAGDQQQQRAAAGQHQARTGQHAVVPAHERGGDEAVGLAFFVEIDGTEGADAYVCGISESSNYEKSHFREGFIACGGICQTL